MCTDGIAVLAANQATPPQSIKMTTKCLFFFFALVAVSSAGLVPAVPAALTVGTYASSYNAHAVNHAYAAPYVAAAAPLTYAAPAYSALPAYSGLPAYSAYSSPLIVPGRR